MQDILDQIMGNTLYMAIAGAAALFIFLFLLKKVFKLAMMILVIALVYGGFLYMTEDDPMKVIQGKLDLGKSTMKELDDATKTLRKETLDKVIEDVDKRLKKSGK